MKRSFPFLLLILLLVAGKSPAQDHPLKLWYDKPAAKWTDALPIGNGTLGGMIYGGIDTEHIQFNEQTLWSGGPRQYQREGASKYLPVIRKLLFEGKQAEAEALAGKHFMGKKSNEGTYVADSVKWVKMVRSYYGPQVKSFHTDNLKTINLPVEKGWEVTPGFEGLDGAVWFIKDFDLPSGWKGKNLVLSLGRVRDIDFTYINGKQIGSTKGTIYRKYVIPASALSANHNRIAIQVLNLNDKGGLTSNAKELMIYPEGEDPAKINPVKLSGEWKYFVQDNNPPASPAYEADYLPFGDLLITQKHTGEITGYYRDLNIEDAVATTSYTNNGVKYVREYLASDPQKVIAVHYTADKRGKITFNATLQTLQKQYSLRRIDNHTIALTLKARHGVLKGTSYLSVLMKNGKVNATNKGIMVTGADEATLYLSAATSFINYKDISGNPDAICHSIIAKVQQKKYEQVKAAHIADYHKYYNTFAINLGGGESSNLPTDERIRQFAEKFDPSLLTLYTQYARYLLISCSRPDSKLPANLQGLWNDQLTPPWGSKFTTNINLEMNYWPAEELNLSQCATPLFSMIKDLSVAGSQTAKIHYNLPGWILHHNTDIWLGTAPINASNHGVWVSGGAWLCHHLWEHYLFTQDKDFLRKAYPIMKACAEFFNGFLVTDPKTGYLISTPSNSPEHGGLVAGPTMDHQIIRDLFKNCIAASSVLNTDAAFRKTLEQKYARIAPNQIGQYGQLQEWLEDKDDTTDTHRHVSHLWGVYPGTDITWDSSPALMHAAEKSFKYRGDEGTGWSLAWKVNLMARFKQGDHALKLIKELLSVAENGTAKERGGVYHNLFDAHPPFQIDGNFGGAAGITELLIQSQQNYIELLPALPASLPDGELKGVCARGGFVLNFTWQQDKLISLSLTSKSGSPCWIKYAGQQTKFNTSPGKTYQLGKDFNWQ